MNKRTFIISDFPANTKGGRMFRTECVNKFTALRRANKFFGHNDLFVILEGTP